jgi:DNA mismatch repair protein MutS2
VRQAQDEVEALRRTAQAQHLDLYHRLAQIEAARREVLNEARAETRELLQSAQQEVTEVRRQLGGSGDLHERWLAEAEAELARRAREAAPVPGDVDTPAPPPTEPFVQGERVWIPSLQSSGEITALDEEAEAAEIQIGSFRLDLPLSRLRKLGEDLEPPSHEHRVARDGGTPFYPSPGTELNLRGMRVEEMLPELEKYLDEAYLAGLPTVRIVHGKGTGRLRQAVRQALRLHARVAAQRIGDPGEGGDGVTVATLVSD